MNLYSDRTSSFSLSLGGSQSWIFCPQGHKLKAQFCNQCIGEQVNHWGSWCHLGASVGLHKKQLTFWGFAGTLSTFCPTITNSRILVFQCAGTKQLIFLYVGFRSFQNKTKAEDNKNRSKEKHLIKPIKQPFVGQTHAIYTQNVGIGSFLWLWQERGRLRAAASCGSVALPLGFCWVFFIWIDL